MHGNWSGGKRAKLATLGGEGYAGLLFGARLGGHPRGGKHEHELGQTTARMVVEVVMKIDLVTEEFWLQFFLFGKGEEDLVEDECK
ncbi:hypothetical protein R1sor_009807 [Riccia sorocarpa]|uniref:Uncharacterized protein n=1 Tax=Riccia sorocarpa TaxID=122646 RepID=A0ABD3HXM0_9MARC